MRIRLEASDRDPYWLIGSPALNERTEMSLALDERVQVTRNQQTITGAEWEGILARDRKNQRLTFTATVRREFADEWARMDFLARLAALDAAEQEHRWEGNVWLRLDKPGTPHFREWKLADAVVGIAGTELKGTVSLMINYTVSVGGFSGEARDGSSEFAALTVVVDSADYGFTVSAASLQAVFDTFQTPETIDFVLRLEAEFAGGGAYVLSSRNITLSGAAVPGTSFPLPMSGSIAGLAADWQDNFATLSTDITESGGVMSVLSAPGVFAMLRLQIYERHFNAYGVLTSYLIGTVNAEIINGDPYTLLFTDGPEYVATALSE